MSKNFLKIIHIKRCFLLAGLAEPAPPLGTILGNLGVNTIKFCEEFNNITSKLPSYFFVKVIIYIYENRSFSFKIKIPSLGFFLNLLKFEKKIKIKYFDRYHDKIIMCIKLKDLIQIALFKFPTININKSIFLI
jgi:large subunit ribosomal protein L11